MQFEDKFVVKSDTLGYSTELCIFASPVALSPNRGNCVLGNTLLGDSMEQAMCRPNFYGVGGMWGVITGWVLSCFLQSYGCHTGVTVLLVSPPWADHTVLLHCLTDEPAPARDVEGKQGASNQQAPQTTPRRDQLLLECILFERVLPRSGIK